MWMKEGPEAEGLSAQCYSSGIWVNMSYKNPEDNYSLAERERTRGLLVHWTMAWVTVRGGALALMIDSWTPARFNTAFTNRGSHLCPGLSRPAVQTVFLLLLKRCDSLDFPIPTIPPSAPAPHTNRLLLLLLLLLMLRKLCVDKGSELYLLTEPSPAPATNRSTWAYQLWLTATFPLRLSSSSFSSSLLS